MEKYFDFEQEAYKILAENNQEHLLREVEKYNECQRKAFADQVLKLDKIIPGGIRQYVKTAKEQLQNSVTGFNPYANYKADIPKGKTLSLDSLEEVNKYEQQGLQQIASSAFCLLAGGMGERLGYKGIKLAITMETVTQQSFLQYYISYIKAYEHHLKTAIPLVIMVSGDTADLTYEFLKKHNNFGLEHLHVIKQEKYPAMINNEGHFALVEGQLEIETKPHGHGDIHSLIYKSELGKQFAAMGKRWLVFFQDTNALCFRSFPAVLGISQEYDLEMNSVTVPRRVGEAVGAIMKLSGNNSSLTINIEYNQINSVLGEMEEATDSQGFSVYPGNINTLVFKLEDYLVTLSKTQGQITEFINPKYTDESRTTFKSSTRLECMMQDYPKLLQSADRVGFSQLDRIFCFAACKNDLESARLKQLAGLTPESASSCEQDFYKQNIKILQLCGVEIEEGQIETLGGIQLQTGPKIVLGPHFGLTVAQVQQKLKGKIRISKQSTLVLKEDVVIDGLMLDGSLQVECHLKDYTFDQKNYVTFQPLQPQQQYPPDVLIRGYSTHNLNNIYVVKQQ